jgi:DNA recombination protein RmuC
MQDIVFFIGAQPISLAQLLFTMGGVAVFLLCLVVTLMIRASRQREMITVLQSEHARELDDKIGEMNRSQAELTGRMQTLADVFGSRQSEFARHVGDRIESLRTQVGQGLEANTRHTGENLAKLNERLAVIDTAQNNLANLTGEMLTLKDILSNKQARGAYGQGQMEAIVRDQLPLDSYTFQATLSNHKRPDCVIHLPNDPRALVIDAKFPLEGFTALRSARGDDERKIAMQRVRVDLGTHVKDMSERYFIAGETQDLALMFVPSEAIYADLHEHFDDVIQRAHRARIVIVAPSLLRLAIQVMQSLMRDARMREEAQTIQKEVGKLLEDVVRISERANKLETHFRQVQEDVVAVKTSSEKVTRRGERIRQLEFDETPKELSNALPLLRAVD